MIVRCDPPRKLTLSLGGGSDEIDGQVFDAIFCMGGGYYPRLVALDEHLRKALPHDYDPSRSSSTSGCRRAVDRRA